MRGLLKHPSVQSLLANLIGLYLSTTLKTIRWTFVGSDNLAKAAAQSIIFVSWHEDLPLMPALWARLRRMPGGNQRRISLLASRSRDGRMIGAIMQRFGAGITAGSTSKGGRAALRSLLETLEAGDHVGLTPDGPRGPRRRAQPGAAQLAALSGVMVLPCGGHVSRGWTLGSWDRMQLPLPFARGVIVCGPPLTVPREGWRESVVAVECALTVAADQACEALMRANG